MLWDTIEVLSPDIKEDIIKLLHDNYFNEKVFVSCSATIAALHQVTFKRHYQERISSIFPLAPADTNAALEFFRDLERKLPIVESVSSAVPDLDQLRTQIKEEVQ